MEGKVAVRLCFGKSWQIKDEEFGVPTGGAPKK